MKKSVALLCSALALGLVATGCGSDDDDEDSDAGGGGGAQTSEPAGEAKAGTVEVAMKNTQFEPQTVNVKSGGVVQWTNDDSVGHDVTKESGPGPDFKSGSAGGMGKGDSFKRSFSAPGEVKYVCTVHPGMKGNIVVK